MLNLLTNSLWGPLFISKYPNFKFFSLIRKSLSKCIFCKQLLLQCKKSFFVHKRNFISY